MEVQGTRSLPVASSRAWESLMDPDVLRKCIPGCKDLTSEGDRKYRLEIEMGIAAIKGRYEGSVEITDVAEEESYTLHIHAEGSPGFVTATLVFRLSAEGGGTLLSYDGTADVGGMIASVGQRMVGGVAKLVAKQFFDALVREIRTAAH